MRNIKLFIEYDGGRYDGLMRLGDNESKNTIEVKIKEVLNKMLEEEVELNFGCRTEVGTHAYEQVANFKANMKMTLLDIKHYLNRYLPMDIAITNVMEEEERFHASLNVKSVEYLYRIAIGDVPSVFDRKYTYYSFKTPNVELMNKAAEVIQGKHDFKKFTSAKRNKSTIKEVYKIEIYKDEQEIQIEIRANDFMHNMARMIIGTILDVGLSNRQLETLPLVFDINSKEEASMPCNTQGLFLQKLYYEN